MSIRKAAQRRSFRGLAVVAGVLVLAGLLQFADANPAASQNQVLFAWKADSDPGLDPGNGAWDRAARVQLPLNAQLGAYAAGGGSIAVASAQALHYGGKLYIRLEWDDPSKDDSTLRVQDFSDAAAVEFPAKASTAVPSICMGQAGAGVNIWQWRADAEGPLVDPAEAHKNSLVESYPSKLLAEKGVAEDVFYTARAAGNPYANPAIGPVQTLVAQAFGSLSPAAAQDVKGKGVYKNGKWAVVFQRQFEGQNPDQATFATSARSDMAFAVWDGDKDDRDGRKQISQFVTLSISAAGGPGTGGASTRWFWLAAGILIVSAVVGIGLAIYGNREASVPR